MKEFGIRKVLGADRGSLIRQANKEYAWVMIISFILGAPLGYWGMQNLLSIIYTDPQKVSIIPFILSISVMTLTIGLTIIGQVLKATRVNPTEILRSE